MKVWMLIIKIRQKFEILKISKTHILQQMTCRHKSLNIIKEEEETYKEFFWSKLQKTP